MRSWSRILSTPLTAAIAFCLPLVVANATSHNSGSRSPSSEVVGRQLAAMPLAFAENRGQWDERVRFRASTGGTTIWFCRDGITYQFTHRMPRDRHVRAALTSEREVTLESSFDRVMPDNLATVVVHAAFVGPNPNVELVGENQLEGRSNYFLGDDPGKWRTDVPNYEAVVYRGVYPGVDLRYDGLEGVLNCAYQAVSVSELAQVSFRYESNAMVTEAGPGQFLANTPWGTIPGLPEAHGLAKSTASTSATPSAFVLLAGVASVSLEYSTYLGGGGSDYAWGIAVDAADCAYVTGETNSRNFPTAGSYDAALDTTDVFVAKLNSTGNALVYSTYLGGSNRDFGYGVAVDQLGCAYVTGGTMSGNYPTLNQYRTDPNGAGFEDVFVTKLSSAGSSLVYSTYIGQGEGFAIAVDEPGSAFVTGRAASTYPTVSSLQAFGGVTDVFVTKLNTAGNDLLYSTFVGGSDQDDGFGITLDAMGDVYVAGQTHSRNYPTVNPFQTDTGIFGDWNAFVTKLAGAGNSIIYSTYLGGNFTDAAEGIAVDVTGSAYVIGSTLSTNFPTVNPFQSSHGHGAVFVSKLAPSGASLIYSTYLTGNDNSQGVSIAVDAAGQAVVTGATYASDFPSLHAFQTYPFPTGTVNVPFVTKFTSAGNAVQFSTCIGDEGSGHAIGLDDAGAAYVAGYTSSANFPFVNAFQSVRGGRADAFVCKFPSCQCPFQGDLNGDTSIDVFDVVGAIGVAFGGESDLQDSGCFATRGDVNNDGVTDVFDVIYLIATAFSGGADPVNPCGP